MTETSEMLVILEGLYRDGDIAARRNFDDLMTCAENAIPPFLWPQLPKTKEELGGLFTASSRSMYLLIFKDIPGYSPMQANFKYESGAWKFEHFALEIGGAFSRIVIEAHTLADAVLISRNYDKLKPKSGTCELHANLHDDKTPSSVM